MLSFLLSEDFPGVQELREQVLHAMVVGQCDCGCPTIEIETELGVATSGVVTRERLAPVEGRVRSLDAGPQDDIILFVDGGRLTCLEYVTSRESSPHDWPPLDRITVEYVPSRSRPSPA